MSTSKIISQFKTIAQRTDKWLTKANAYMYNFKDGHFQFPYAPSDPELMIESLKKTPFVTFDKEYQCLETNSPFMKVKQNFAKVEQGFWIIVSQVLWKVKVKVVALVDDEPSDYYFLSYSRTTDSIKVFVDKGNIEYESYNQTWNLYKSNTAMNAYFQSNSRVNSTFLVFTKKWILDKTKNITTLDLEIIEKLLNSGSSFKTYLYDTIEISNRSNQIHQLLDNIRIQDVDFEELKNLSSQMVILFFETAAQKVKLNQLQPSIKSEDSNKVLKIEKLLCKTLTSGFLGIDKLAEEFKISPTKLKNDFKSVFGMGVFQYYQKKQMELALEMLKQKFSIQEIAKTLNYESQSKFSSKFRDIYGMLPSKYF